MEKHVNNRLYSIFIVSFMIFIFNTIRANFIWPTVARECGLFNSLFWGSVICGLIIELLFLKRLLPAIPLKKLFVITMTMNIASALFGAIFFSITNISLQHLIGIAWFWNETILYGATVICNVIIESSVCIRFIPTISRQPLIMCLLFANIISVGMCWISIIFGA